MKDRSHYGFLVEDRIAAVTPEQARAWLGARPPAPIMWSRNGANQEKSACFAALMQAGMWNNDLPVEPVMINAEHGYILGGHHRLTAVTLLGRPQELRVMKWSKPHGWDRQRRENPESTQTQYRVCSECGWWAQDSGMVERHITRTHGIGSVREPYW
jgi:hypothetical protein